MKKSWTRISLAIAATLIASFAISIRAQKQSGAQHSHAEQHGAQPAPNKDAQPAPNKEETRHADCPMRRADKSVATGAGRGHDSHLAEVNERGARAMGFSQTATTHHFILTRDGGLIQVEVNDPKDAENLSSIRQHLANIARMFGEGNFDTPMIVHDREPEGVPAMRRLKAGIKYAFEETERGARVRITTTDADARSAVHEFLRFQIKDHQTGDPLEVNDQ
ncbi:MAG TPA: hypothetical protein VEX60_08470 [Pyrinomonadaceae bacterium]|nr:hypothetical protein [Pyrinomonadaceae bacterium]